MKNREIEKDLLHVLNKYVPTAEYLNAENNARKTEETDGTLTDLRDQRDRVLRSLNDLAVDILRLQEDVYGLSAMDGGLKDLIAEAADPFRAYGDSIAAVQRKHERFPCDDEHQSAP